MSRENSVCTLLFIIDVCVESTYVLFAESLEGSKDQGLGYRPRGCLASPCALATKRQQQETALAVPYHQRYPNKTAFVVTNP